MIKGICYYHNDSDGIMSAAIVEKFMQEPEKEMIYIPVQYGYDETEFLKQHMQETYEYIFVVDFSFTKNIMENLQRQATKEFVWIDHHKSAMEKLPDMWNSDQIGGLREIGKSGSLLTWEWFCPHEKAPSSVKLINDYDLWKHESEDSKPFHEAFCLLCQTPARVPYYNLLDNEWSDDVLKMRDLGDTLMTAKMQRIEKVFKTGNETNILGPKGFIVNSQHDTSDLGNYILEQGHDLAIIYSHKSSSKGTIVVFSLRSKGDLDVSEIAKQYGGGGHKNAAGFSVDFDTWYS